MQGNIQPQRQAEQGCREEQDDHPPDRTHAKIEPRTQVSRDTLPPAGPVEQEQGRRERAVHGQTGQDDGRERQGDDLQRVQHRPDPQKPGKGEGNDKEKEN